MTPISRRTLLAAAGSSLVRPWSKARAQAGSGEGGPQRLIVFYTPNGFLPDRLRPLGKPGGDLMPGPTMDPLFVHRNDLIVIEGLENRAASQGKGPADDRSMATLLTGTDLANGATTGFASGGGISLDQQIGLQSANLMVLPPLVLGIGTAGLRTTLATPSYTGSRAPVVPAPSLGPVADKLFPPQMLPGALGEPRFRRALQQVALDAARKNVALLRGRVAATDARRLDGFDNSLHEVRAQLDASSSQCAPGGNLAALPDPAATVIDAGRAAIDLVVSAFSCDRARVATLVWEGAGGNAAYPGVRGGHNDLARAAAAGNGTARASLASIESQLMGALAHLLDALSVLPDGAGRTLLDSTLVLVCSDVASVAPMSWRGLPCLLAGRAGGRLTTGRYLAPAGATWNQLLVSILQLFGHQFTAGLRFGNPAYGEGPLPGLV